MNASNDSADVGSVSHDGVSGIAGGDGAVEDSGVADGGGAIGGERDVAADGPPLADVIAFAATESGVEVSVVSTGCTTRESVEAHVERLDADTVALTVRRVKPDGCRRVPFGVSVELGRDELGIGDEAIVLENPLSPLPGRGRR